MKTKLFAALCLLLSTPLICIACGKKKEKSMRTIAVHEVLSNGPEYDWVPFEAADTAAVMGMLPDREDSNSRNLWVENDGKWNLITIKTTPEIEETVEVSKVEDTGRPGYYELTWKFPIPVIWEKITRNNIGRPLTVFIDGKFAGAPTVNEPIESGNCMVIIPSNYLSL